MRNLVPFESRHTFIVDYLLILIKGYIKFVNINYSKYFVLISNLVSK